MKKSDSLSSEDVLDVIDFLRVEVARLRMENYALKEMEGLNNVNYEKGDLRRLMLDQRSEKTTPGKSFLQGFRIGFKKNIGIGVLIAITLWVGINLGLHFHSYEECSRMYDTQEDISECVWIMENR